MPRKRKFDYHYMDVTLPGDLFIGVPKGKDVQEMESYAIDAARDRMRTYRMPASWTAHVVKGTVGESYEVTVRVCRKSNRAR